MKKFKCTVERTYDYEIEFDETVWTPDELKNWSTVFATVDSLENLAEILAGYKPDYESGEFIEGFGIPMINGKEPFVFKNEEINKDININILSTDQSVDVEEII